MHTFTFLTYFKTRLYNRFSFTEDDYQKIIKYFEENE